MICFHQRCPHCGDRQVVELEDDLTLPTQREREVPSTVLADPVDAFMTSECPACHATFIVDFVVRERLWVATLTREALVQLNRPRPFKHIERTRDRVPCGGCGRFFGEGLEPHEGKRLCKVCAQEVSRLLAVGGGR